MGEVNCTNCKKAQEQFTEFIFPSQQNHEKEEAVSHNSHKDDIKEIESVLENQTPSEEQLRLLGQNQNLRAKREILEAKEKYEEQLRENGAEIFEEEGAVENLLRQKNPMAMEVHVPKEMMLARAGENNDEVFYVPLIKFPTGEYFSGFVNKNFQKQGYGIQINEDGTVYKGFWQNNDIDYGAIIDKNDTYYIGEIKEKKPEGTGEIFEKNKYKFEGKFVNGIPEGEGTFTNFKDGSVYVGSMRNGKKVGYGKMTKNDGTVYEGEFAEDCFNGHGILNYSTGQKYDGDFKDGKIEGYGKFYWEDGKVYEGNFINGQKSGLGKMIWSETQYYEGNWVNDLQHGEGVYYLDGKFSKGKFRFGKIIRQNS